MICLEAENFMFNDYSEVIMVDELREILYIGKNQAYNLLRSKKIKATKVGSVWRIPCREVLKYLGYETES